LKAANVLRDSTENYITPQALQDILIAQEIDSNQQPILTQWLHDLGDILYFQDKNELEDIVILKPQWVTEYISQVLESQDVINSGGILTRSEMKKLWHDLTPTMCERMVQLSIRGPNPPNFFALLKDGLEVTLARFPGLKIKRQIPCMGHQGQACPHEFNYDQLLKRYEKKKFTIECPETLEDVSVPQLLYGWDWRTQDLVLSRLDQLGEGQDQILAGQNQISSELKALRELTQRETK